MKLESPYWDEQLGVCTKHGLPSVPCPQCMATQDTDVSLELSYMDWDFIAVENYFKDPDAPLFGPKDLIQPDWDWLLP